MSKEFSNSFDSPVNKFEQMLQTNSVLFFDVQEFESIIHHYIDSGEINLARKELASIANYYYKESKKGIESFSPESRIAINACIELYGKLNDRIISRGNDIKYRESLSWSEKLGALPISKYWKLPAAYLKS